ncbi:MATE family efflux transporter [Pelagerythrobacter marensis]|uniref:Na(+) driven multidrug efflux pump n=1 Tax=Pelagerythrobacter marensis TaxID=543877 RepID=A0A0G3X455_9SPHN|nr:MATE family efflux transporter [Pelagerythrobacter marensis]AKM06320.1 Na(+) driven multidrug efflux pump [Pelagerythrobacter marensis]
MNETAKLTRGSIRGHLVQQTLPMVVGVAAIMSVGLVDAYFIGQLGSAELAAVAFVFPVTIALSSLGVGVMVGVNAVIARALGEGDVDRAARRANFGAVFAVGLGLALGCALYLLLDPLFRMMQASEQLLPLIRAYMVPFSLGMPILLLQMALNGVLRGQGEARKTFLVSLSYAAANWVLDPPLISGAFGFAGFGIAGAAYATIAGYGLAIAMALWLIARTALPIRPALIRECRFAESARAIVRVAAPAAFSNAINPIGLSVLTALLASQGEAAVAGFGAAGRLQSFAVVPLLGLSGSIGAIVGQNWGAGRADRASRAMREAGAFCIVYGFALALVLFAAGEWFAGFFTADPAVVAEFDSYLRIAAWGYAGFGLLIVANGALNAVDRASWALLQSFARVFLIMLPVGWVLRPAWGAESIYAAELAANLIGGAIALYVVARALRKTATSR